MAVHRLLLAGVINDYYVGGRREKKEWGWGRSRVEEESFDVFSVDLLQAKRQILRYSSDEKLLGELCRQLKDCGKNDYAFHSGSERFAGVLVTLSHSTHYLYSSLQFL